MSVVSWRAIEEVPWEPISSLGQQWMVKSTANDRGYMVMLTDGSVLFGEQRRAKYILDQADEWAPCIEAGITELSKLILSEMKNIGNSSWGDDREKVTISISSQLNDMSYTWEFYLQRLNDELFSHHWTTPLLVQFHHLGTRVKQLTTELENKQRQLEELLPDKINSKNANKSSSKKKVAPIESSAEAVMSSGPWTVMQDQLVLYPQIMKHLHKIRNPDFSDEVPSGTQSNSVNNGSNKRELEEKNEEESEALELKKQQERRAKIQEIIQGTDMPATSQQKKKKKKILKI